MSEFSVEVRQLLVARRAVLQGGVAGLVGCAIAALAAPVAVAGGDSRIEKPGPPWTSEHHQEHPLVGKLWHPAAGRFESSQTLAAALATTRFVLLGEKHDNADHHRFQAWAVKQMFDRGRRPAAALEMIRSDQEAALADHRAAYPGDAAGLGEALSWQETGWPAWAYYQPIVEPFLAADLPIGPASLSKSTLRQVVREGIGVLGPVRGAALGLEALPEGAMLEEMKAEIVAAHCNQLPSAMIEPMVTASLVKDAVMAEALRGGADLGRRDGAVLVAGNGHVRLDRGVPWHLTRLSPGSQVLSIGLLEVVEDRLTPAAYGGFFGTADLPFDFVWFSPRASVGDPCERFADSLSRAKQRHLDERDTNRGR